MTPQRWLKVFALIGAVTSLWFAGLHIYWSLFTSHLDHIWTMSGDALVIEIATLATFYFPKIGVIAGGVAVFVKPKLALIFFVVSWIIAVFHSIFWYFPNDAFYKSSIEYLRLTMHHLIPHFFFAVMTLALLMNRRTMGKILDSAE